MIADGYNAEVDELRGIIDNSKDYKNRIEARERERTGIKTLKIGYNKVFGYYIEVSKSYTSLVPDDYVRKQTLTTGERYITDELKDMEATILGARDKLSSLEYDIFCGLRDRVSESFWYPAAGMIFATSKTPFVKVPVLSCFQFYFYSFLF